MSTFTPKRFFYLSLNTSCANQTERSERSSFQSNSLEYFTILLEVWSEFGQWDPKWDLALFKGNSPTGTVLPSAATQQVSVTPSSSGGPCVSSSQLLSALTKIGAALPSQGRLCLEGIPKVRRWHQKPRRLAQVDCVGCLEAARRVGRRWRCHKAARLCPGKGEPANRAASRTGTCGGTGLPRRRPEACWGQDHGKSLGLIAPQRESYRLRRLFRS